MQLRVESRRIHGGRLEAQPWARFIPAQEAHDQQQDGGRTRRTARRTQDSKRIHVGDFQFQVIQAPPVQPVLLRDITPSVNNWRTGFNNNPAGLDVKTMQQVQAESDYPGCNIKLVRLAQRDNIESVVARRSMRDGDVVCTLGGLAYDSVENLRAFMNGNPIGRELVGGLVRIDGVQHEALGDEGSAPQALGDFSPTAPKFAPI